MKFKTLIAALILSFLVSGCMGYKNYADFKAHIKPSDYDVTITKADFNTAKASILNNTPRCFASRYNMPGECKVYKLTSRSLEIGCYRKYEGKVVDFAPYIKAEKIDDTHVKTSIYGDSIINTIVVEWIKGEHQMCPSIL